MDQPPEIFVLAGPNGAGKTTAARLLLPKRLHVEQFVNADLIAQGLSPFAPEKMAMQAGGLMLERIRELRARGDSFAFETTLATRSYLSFLREAQERGFLVHLIYIWLSSVQLALSRVAVRVRLGGHHVPAEIVERRYWRGLRNFFELYQPLVNAWTLCNNSGEDLTIIAWSNRGEELQILDPDTYRRVQEQATHGS